MFKMLNKAIAVREERRLLLCAPYRILVQNVERSDGRTNGNP